MEPVGGGRLAKLPKEAHDLLEKERPGCSAAAWALRFVANLSNVAIVLSGMSDFEQLSDNLAAFDPVVPLSENENAALRNVVEILVKYKTVPCTACGYCVGDCRENVDIPQIFKRYNDYRQFDNMARFDIDYFAFVPEARRAGNCVQCGECVKKCPQKIDIPRELEIIHNTAAGLSLGVDIDKLKDPLFGGASLVCFGAGAMGRSALSVLRECGIKVRYFCDNSERLWGMLIDGVEIVSPKRLQTLAESENLRVLITSGYYSEIKEQLNAMNAPIVNEGMTDGTKT
jgi:ferredoxin